MSVTCYAHIDTQMSLRTLSLEKYHRLMLSTKSTITLTSSHQPYTHENSTVNEVNKVNQISDNQCQPQIHTYLNTYMSSRNLSLKSIKVLCCQPSQPCLQHHFISHTPIKIAQFMKSTKSTTFHTTNFSHITINIYIHTCIQ